MRIDPDKDGECFAETVFEDDYGMVAFETDPEDMDHLYVLNEEQQLLHLFDPTEGKLVVDSKKDLSANRMEDAIEFFKNSCVWSSMPVDGRTISLNNFTFSTLTNFSWEAQKGEE